LNAVLPEGMVAIEAAEAVDKVKELVAAEYRIILHCPASVVQSVLNQTEILVEKRTKKKTMKTMDIKPYFIHPVLAEVGEDTTVMEVTLPSGSAENINPGLFVTALGAVWGREIKAEYLRKRLLKADGTEFL